MLLTQTRQKCIKLLNLLLNVEVEAIDALAMVLLYRIELRIGMRLLLCKKPVLDASWMPMEQRLHSVVQYLDVDLRSSRLEALSESW